MLFITKQISNKQVLKTNKALYSFVKETDLNVNIATFKEIPLVVIEIACSREQQMLELKVFFVITLIQHVPTICSPLELTWQ